MYFNQICRLKSKLGPHASLFILPIGQSTAYIGIDRILSRGDFPRDLSPIPLQNLGCLTLNPCYEIIIKLLWNYGKVVETPPTPHLPGATPAVKAWYLQIQNINLHKYFVFFLSASQIKFLLANNL